MPVSNHSKFFTGRRFERKLAMGFSIAAPLHTSVESMSDRNIAGVVTLQWGIVPLRMDEGITQRYADEIRRIARQHGALRIRVFGSHAAGTASSSSDVDFLVALEPRRDLLDLVALKQDLEHLLGLPVDVVEEEGLSPYLREKILQDARPV
jgi:predicted nucleotidyltransferase